MDFKNGYEEIESIKPRTSYLTYLTLMDWLKSIDPQQEMSTLLKNSFSTLYIKRKDKDNELRDNFLKFLEEGYEDEYLKKRQEQFENMLQFDPDYLLENYGLTEYDLSDDFSETYLSKIDFNKIYIFFKKFLKSTIKEETETDIECDYPFLPLTGLFLLKALGTINFIKECSEKSNQLKGLIIHELFGYENNEDFLNEIKKANKLEKDVDIDCDFYLVNKTLAHDFYWGDRAKVFISKKLFERQGLTYPNPEELDDERMEELLLDPDEFDEPMYELVFDFWTYCDTEERVEVSDILNYYGIEKRFLHPLSDYRFL